MRHQYTIAEYEELWQNDPTRYGCVSIEQAIDSLQMDVQAVSMLIDKGVLECFDIGGGSNRRSLVTLKSLLLFKSARTAATQDRPRRILNILTDAARSKKTLLYGDVMQTVGLAYQDAMHREIFKKDLREAVRQSALFAHGLLISVLLVFKIQYIPEDDFFVMAEELGMFTAGKDSKTVFFKNHLQRVFQYYGEA